MRTGNVSIPCNSIQAEIGALAESFARYMAAWTDERITRDWRGFCADSDRILDALAGDDVVDTAVWGVVRHDRVLAAGAGAVDG